MSDFKATIKIQFKIFGEEYKKDAYINYSDGTTEEEIKDWFSECYRKAYHKYQAEV